MADEGIVYAACRERFIELVRGLDDDQRATRVAATEAWTVHDVVSHQAGVVADVNAMNLDGIGTDAWTAAQVDARRGRPTSEILDEWEQGAPQFEATITAIGGGQAAIAIADIWNHEQDVRGAVGVEGGRDPLAEQFAIKGYCELQAGRIAEAGVPALRLRAGVDEWVWGEDEPAATVIAEPYELARLICGRRTSDQLRAYLWDGDPEPYVALLGLTNVTEPLPT